MAEVYDPQLKARLTLDDAQRVRGINHLDELWPAEEQAPRKAAISYLQAVSETLEVPKEQLEYAHQPVSFFNPRSQETQLRLSEEKRFFDSTTQGFYQTHLNVPVWAAGVTVTVKHNPTRVVSAANTTLDKVDAKLPSEEVIERWRKIMDRPEPRLIRRDRDGFIDSTAGGMDDENEETETGAFVGEVLSGYAFKRSTAKAVTEARERARRARVLSGRFFIYRYDPEARLRDRSGQAPETGGNRRAPEDASPLAVEPDPTLPLPPVDEQIEPGRDYLVAELVFFYPTDEWGEINWRALVELETGSVLYLRPLAAHVNGLVFHEDPISESGNTANGPTSTNATLNPFRDDVVLPNLDAPVGGNQSLSGTHVALNDEESPSPGLPTEPTGTDFDYAVRSDDFAAVNAYYHANRFFDLVEDLGFPLATYFDGTTFPVPVDPRGLGTKINAHCVGTGSGIDHLCYALADLTNTSQPIGIATDWRVHLHELGGHGILHDHVGGPNFGFAHSAGDSMAIILADPESQAPDRFLLAPFVPAVSRRSDRGVAEWSVASIAVTSGGSGYTTRPNVTVSGGGGAGATAFVPSWGLSGGSVTAVLVGLPGTGFTSAPTVSFSGGGGSGASATATLGTWAWSGGMDLGGYRSEEILSTTLFRIYRSIGGDSGSLGRRQFAARFMAYLILRTVSTLTPATNPGGPLALANAMMATDLLNWTSEGVDGGAYGKVIRWSFEKQGLYQPGSPAPGTVTTEGNPPTVDVYIDDGRAGEYPYLSNHWSTTTIWNRLSDDGLTTHQPPVLGTTNYAYVKIKNRGTQQAQNVVVHGYHTKPSAGLLWPDDFEAFGTAQLPAGTLNPNNTEEKIIGPFAWTPNINAYGHDCMLMIVSATNDPSNVDHFTAGEVIPEWRLVPNDNNVGQRNVNPVPAGSGTGGLIAGLHGFPFWVRNPNPRRAVIDIQVKLPDVLSQRGWRLGFEGLRSNRFSLASREQRELTLALVPGAEFDPADVQAAGDADIVVTARADGGVIGGMVYRLDPDMKEPANVPGGRPDRGTERCREHAGRLLDCLNVRDHDICKVRVKKVTVDITMDDDDCC